MSRFRHASTHTAQPRICVGLLGAVCALATCATCAAVAAPDVGQAWPVGLVPMSSAVSADGGSDPSQLPAGVPLTLAELTDFALRHNPATRALWASALGDVFVVDAARAQQWPTVEASVPLGLSHGGGGSGGVVRSVAPSLSLLWVLFDFGARASIVDAARWQSVASQLAYNRELQTVVGNVELAYFTLLGAQRLERAYESAVKAAQASLDAAQARRRAGLATVADTAQAEAARGLVELQLVQALATTRSARGALASAVGVPVTTSLSLADAHNSFGTASMTGTDADSALLDDTRAGALQPGIRVDDLLATARLSRADLVALDALVLQGQAQVAATQALGLPSLALSAQAARRWGSDFGGPSTQQIGLTLSIPLFDGGLVRAQTQAARARVQSLAAQRAQQRQAVDLEVWQSFQAADSTAAALASARSLLRSAAVSEDAARERYRAGVGSLLELLLAQSTAVQARVSLVQAHYGGQLALSRLGYAVGAGLGSRLVSGSAAGALGPTPVTAPRPIQAPSQGERP